MDNAYKNEKMVTCSHLSNYDLACSTLNTYVIEITTTVRYNIHEQQQMGTNTTTNTPNVMIDS